MTIKYNCTVNYSDYEDGLDMELVSKAICELEKEYDVYTFDGGFELDGEIESDLDGDSARDIAGDITWKLWNIADIDADVDTETHYSDEEDRLFSTYTLHILP